jgi:CRP-like cAMP-binding protein
MTAIEILRGLPLCAGLDDDDLKSLTALTHEVHFPARSLMLVQGEPSAHAYAIASGRVAVLRSLPGGGEVLLAESGPGSMMGEIGLLAEQRRIASVRALDDVHAVRFDRATLAAACRMRQPVARELTRGIIRQVCAQVRGLIEHLGSALPPADHWKTPAPDAPEPQFDYQKFLPLLRCAPLFGPHGLDHLAALAPARQFIRGEILFQRGEADTGIALVVRGAIELIARGTADSQALQVFGPGSFCGLPSAVDREPHAGVARAREHTLVLHLAQVDFDAHYERADEFGYCLMSVVGEQLADCMPRLCNRLAQQLGLQRAQTILARGVLA